MEERLQNPCPSGVQPTQRGSAGPYPTLSVGLEEEVPTSIPLRPSRPQVSSTHPPATPRNKGGGEGWGGRDGGKERINSQLVNLGLGGGGWNEGDGDFPPGNFPGGRWAAAGRGPTGAGWSWCPLQYLPFSPVRHPPPPPPLNPADPGGSVALPQPGRLRGARRGWPPALPPPSAVPHSPGAPSRAPPPTRSAAARPPCRAYSAPG